MTERRARLSPIGLIVAVALGVTVCVATLVWIFFLRDPAPTNVANTGVAAVDPHSLVDGAPPGSNSIPRVLKGEDGEEMSSYAARSAAHGSGRANRLGKSAGGKDRARQTGAVTPGDGAQGSVKPDGRPVLHDPDDEADEDAATGPRLSISGHVFDDLGVPVPALDMVTVPRQLFDQAGGQDAAPGEHDQFTFTDFDGAYTFSDLPDGEYYVRTFQTELYGQASVAVRAGTDTADLVVARQFEFRVRGSVQSPGGEPLAGVRVSPIGQPRAVTTNERGSYELQLMVTGSQRYQVLRFQADGYQVHEVRLEEAELQTMDAQEIDVTLQPIVGGAEVKGTVKASNGTVVPGETVSLHSPSRKRRYAATTDDGGRFTLENVEIASDYRLWIRPKGPFRDYGESRINVTPEGRSFDIVLEPIDRGHLSGNILNTEGEPLPRFPLWLRSSSASTQIVEVTGDANGHYAVYDVPAGDLVVETRSFPVLRVSGIRVELGEQKDLDIIIDRGPYVIYGRVSDSYGQAVPGAEITLFWSRDYDGVRSRSTRRAVAGISGDFTFSQIGAGPHAVSVRALGYQSAHLNHEVGPGAGEIDVVLNGLP